jgi:LysM repeat protein
LRAAGVPPTPTPTSPPPGCTNTYTVQSGDYCYLIWTKYGLSENQFKSLNPGIDCNNLQIGQQVCVAGGPGGPSSPPPGGLLPSIRQPTHRLPFPTTLKLHHLHIGHQAAKVRKTSLHMPVEPLSTYARITSYCQTLGFYSSPPLWPICLFMVRPVKAQKMDIINKLFQNYGKPLSSYQV